MSKIINLFPTAKVGEIVLVKLKIPYIGGFIWWAGKVTTVYKNDSLRVSLINPIRQLKAKRFLTVKSLRWKKYVDSR